MNIIYMKTIKFRLLEHIKKKGYTAISTFSIQYKTGLFWQDYTVDNGGLHEPKILETAKDCVDEIFLKSRFKSTDLRLKQYPTLKFITTIKK